jgi:hypothetical protein
LSGVTTPFAPAHWTKGEQSFWSKGQRTLPFASLREHDDVCGTVTVQ